MDKLGSRERGQLKSLLAGESLPTDAQNSIINILRTDLPDFFSQLTSGLEKIKSANNNEVAKYLKLNTGKTRQILKKQKLTFLTQQEQNELGSALEEPAATGGVVYQQGQAPAEQPIPAGGSSGGGMPGMPSMGGMSSPSGRSFRIVRNVPQVEKPDIALANSTGTIKEVGDPSKLVSTTSTGQIKEVGQPSKLVVPGRETGDASKLVSARSDGSIIQTAPKNPTIHIADKSGNVVKSYNIKSPSRFSNLRSKVGSGISRAANTGLERANPFLKKAGRGLMNGLSGITNSGGMGGIGGGSRSALGKIGRFGRGGVNTGKSFLTKGSGKKAALAFAGVFFMIFFMGMLGGMNGSTSTGEAAPISTNPSGSSDISSCKFTRAGNSQLIKSSILAGWISAAAASAGVPAQILASVAMHENQDFSANADNNHDAIKTGQYCIKGKMFCEDGKGHVFHSKQGEDDPCTSSELAAGNRNAQAVGLMQNIDIYNPGKDLCSITENLKIAAAKLKNDGIAAQPTQDQVTQAIHAYYNDCDYGSFSYCNEVWTDYQNCQTGSSGTVPPPAAGLTGVTAAATTIDSLLFQKAPNSSNLEDRLFHNKKDEFGVYYWCTYIVVDAYNTAGFSGLTRAAHGGVLNMKSFFANTPGYQLLPADTPVEQLRPGDVIFFEGSNDQHVSLVKAIAISQEGNGFIFTFEANNVVLQDAVTVQNHKAISAMTSANKFRITSFGQAKVQ